MAGYDLKISGLSHITSTVNRSDASHSNENIRLEKKNINADISSNISSNVSSNLSHSGNVPLFVVTPDGVIHQLDTESGDYIPNITISNYNALGRSKS